MTLAYACDDSDGLAAERVAGRIVEIFGVLDEGSAEDNRRWTALVDLVRTELAQARADGRRRAVTPRWN